MTCFCIKPQLGQPQQCPVCNHFNPSGLKLPDQCINCNYPKDSNLDNIETVDMEDIRNETVDRILNKRRRGQLT